MFFLRREIKKILNQDSLVNYDSLSLQQLSGILNNYIPWTSSSIRPGAIVKIINDILINNRRNIIEFGGGMSTLYIAYMLKKNGGHLYTIDHDDNWIELVKEMLKKENLEDVVTFVHAPMEKSKHSIDNLDWYSENSMNTMLGDEQFDLVLVDGPLAYTKDLELSRYPAIPYLMDKNKISESSTIICDDINRNGEQAIVKKWEVEYKLKFKLLFKDGGIAISQTGTFYNI